MLHDSVQTFFFWQKRLTGGTPADPELQPDYFAAVISERMQASFQIRQAERRRGHKRHHHPSFIVMFEYCFNTTLLRGRETSLQGCFGLSKNSLRWAGMHGKAEAGWTYSLRELCAFAVILKQLSLIKWRSGSGSSR
jgi:hypothetical protein